MWFTYILLCADGSYYTGISNNIEKRFLDHKNGNGGAYTRSHRVIKIVYQEKNTNKSEALKRELQIKKMTKREKNLLINKT